MTDREAYAEILQDLSLLYELSLSVGNSIDLSRNCEVFLRTLMARKSLDSAAVWIREDLLVDQGDTDALVLVYSDPKFRGEATRLEGGHAIPTALHDGESMSLSFGHSDFGAVSRVDNDRGTVALFRLGEVGVLKLYSIARKVPFPTIELNKLRSVVEKFTVSLQGCLDHIRIKEVQKQRQDLELQMLHAQKLESLGILAGGVAHDFNNILTVILGQADLSRTENPSPTVLSRLDSIVESAQRAADLCAQLLAYSGKGQFIVRPVCLSDVISRMMNLLQVSVSKKARLRCELTDGLPAVEADVTQIRQIILNLAINASEALRDGVGTITIRTRLLQADERELRGCRPRKQLDPGDYVVVEVEDTGSGMDDETQQRLFDPFFTTKFTGRGLGLAAALGIVSSHSGAMQVKSRVGEGTCMRILLPPSTQAASQLTGSPAEVSDSHLGTGTILVADDEEAVRSLAEAICRQMGYQVITAANGREAVEQFEAHQPDIALVILDLTMPVLAGDEALEKILGIDPQARVILSSGYSAQEIRERIQGHGSAEFLKKPYTLDDVKAVVQKVLKPRSHESPPRGDVVLQP